MKKEATYIYGLTLLYFIVSLVGIIHHELWLDESQHWLLARDSNSFSDFMHNIRFEGHPILWDSLLFLITRFTHNPFGMQLLHILIATLTVFVFLRKAPFSKVFKALFIFGYFMIFEYDVISRNYILGILFLFLACSAFKDREKKFTLLCLYLALAANVHLIFAVVAIGMFSTLVFERFINKPPRVTSPRSVGYIVFTLGMAAVFFLIAKTEGGWLFDTIKGIPWEEKFTKGYISIFKGLITVPDFREIHFWSTNLLVNISKPVAGILGLLAWLLPLFLFFRNRTILFFVYITLIGIQVFFFITQRAAVRFDGIAYLIIIMALWLENYSPAEKMVSAAWQNKKAIVVYGILSIQFVSGITAYSMDYIYPFTAAKDVASFLKRENLENEKIVTLTCDGTMISPYLERKIYFLSENSEHSYCDWTTGKGIFTKDDIEKMLTEYVTKNGNIIFLSGYRFVGIKSINESQSLNDKITVKLLARYNNNIIPNSKFSIYEVSRINPQLN